MQAEKKSPPELDFDDPAVQAAFRYGMVVTKVGPDGSVSYIPLDQLWYVEEPANAG